MGDGNNIAGSLALACASLGANFTLASPKGYQIPTKVWEEARSRASAKECTVKWVEQREEAVRGAAVVYSDVWVSMGLECGKGERSKDYES